MVRGALKFPNRKMRPRGEEYLTFLDTRSARDFLLCFLFDSNSMARLRRIVSRRNLLGCAHFLDDREVLEQLARRLWSGRLKIHELPHVTWGSGQEVVPSKDKKDQKDKKDNVPPVPPVPEKEIHYIEVKVVDADTEEAIQGANLKIKLPSGKVKTFVSKKSDAVREKELPANAWDIQEIADSEVWEVVRVS